MTTPLETDWMRSLVIKPVSTEGSTRGEIVAGRGPKDTSSTFWLPAGVHQVMLDFPEDRWISLWGGGRNLFGMDGPFNGRMVRVVLGAPDQIVAYVSTADPAKPILVGVTIFQVPA